MKENRNNSRNHVTNQTSDLQFIDIKKEEATMENKKTNRSKALTMLLLLVTLIVTMGVMVGCDKKEKTPDSENDTTEVVEVTEETEEPESEDAEDPVEVEEPEVEVTEEPEETEEPLDYIVREDGRIQPAVHYASIMEFEEFVDSLELEEAVVILYSEERNTIIYNGDSFETGEGDVLELYLSREELSYNCSGVDLFEIFGVDNIYGISYNKENGSREFSIQLEYGDGTTEEFTANLIIE